jgi:polyferredoxin
MKGITGPRTAILAIFFIIFFGVFATGLYKIDNYCPVGMAVRGISDALGTGAQHTKDITYALPLALLASVFFFGNWFCGYSCPIGAGQEWLHGIGKRFKLNVTVPKNIDKAAKKGKYLILATILVATPLWRTEIYWQFDPFRTIFVQETTTIGALLLAAVIAGAFFVERPFCRYICPIGALLNISSRLGFFKITHNEEECNHCSLCSKACPVGLDPENNLKDIECQSCLRCVAICPTDAKDVSTGVKLGNKFPFAALAGFAALAVIFSILLP